MIKVDFDFAGDLFNKTLDVDISLPKFANEIKKSVETDLRTPKSFDGSGLKPLSRKYAQLKRRKLGRAVIFDGFRKGKHKLINSVITKKISDNEQEITMTDENIKIMGYLQRGGRKGFGISQNAINNIFSKLKINLKFT